jgi:hypothetical protein
MGWLAGTIITLPKLINNVPAPAMYGLLAVMRRQASRQLRPRVSDFWRPGSVTCGDRCAAGHRPPLGAGCGGPSVRRALGGPVARSRIVRWWAAGRRPPSGSVVGRCVSGTGCQIMDSGRCYGPVGNPWSAGAAPQRAIVDSGTRYHAYQSPTSGSSGGEAARRSAAGPRGRSSRFDTRRGTEQAHAWAQRAARLSHLLDLAIGLVSASRQETFRPARHLGVAADLERMVRGRAARCRPAVLSAGCYAVAGW